MFFHDSLTSKQLNDISQKVFRHNPLSVITLKNYFQSRTMNGIKFKAHKKVDITFKKHGSLSKQN